MELLQRFSQSLASSDVQALVDVREYIEWQTGRRATETPRRDVFIPTENDDVDLRTYLLHLRTEGADRAALEAKRASLKQFYQWAKAEGIIFHTPFEDFNFDRPFLTRDEIRRREDTIARDSHERELLRLRGLNQLAAHLNRSADVQTALDGTLEILLKVMNLQTAWAFILTESGTRSVTFSSGDPPPHDFALAAACGLPRGLEQDERRFLCEPPDCHCQQFFRSGRLTHAVNVVECTRLQKAAASRGDTQGLLFHASEPLTSQGKLLGLLNLATSEWQLLTSADLQFLSAVGAQVAVALERAQMYDLVREQRDHLERELQVAHDVQASLLPRELPDIPGFRFAADWRSARQVAGDFYDIFPLHEGCWGIVIGDVSDKGAPAALYMAMARSLIRTMAMHKPSPAATLMQVNATINAQSSYTMFVTVVYAVFDPATHTLTYANAGHNPPIVRRASGAIERLPRTGGVVGAFEKLDLTEAAVTLASGDALVLYTDGVTDALNAAGEDYGMDRLIAASTAAPATAPALLDSLRADLAAFTQSAPQPDDITFFVLTHD
jgi:serine phosphatase RsbU (regulator of sigma subunit)